MHDEARKYKYRHQYDLIDSYVFPEDVDKWLECPVCNSKPKVWKFDNGRSASCKCHNSTYDHFAIYAESIKSCIVNDGGGVSFANYDDDALRDNWNHWVKTGEILFEHAGKRNDGRW